MKKYEFVERDTIEHNGVTLKRIRAINDFGGVFAGDLGGYIEDEKNLAHEGNAWVSGNAQVYGNAEVSGNARVYGDAWVSGNAWVYGDARVSGDAEITKTPINIIGLAYNVTIYAGLAQVGCKLYTLEEWLKFSEDAIRKMDGDKAVTFYPKLVKILEMFGGVSNHDTE